LNICDTELSGLKLIKPNVFGDRRGFFFESWHVKRYGELGLSAPFVQDNISSSVRGTLRGLHFQNPNGQGKLVTVLQGEIFDVAVDVRLGSPTFGKWVGETLSADNFHQLYIPPHFAHGFCVLSETALFSYKCTDYYCPETEITISWNDPDIAIHWPVTSPILSEKDKRGFFLKDVPKERIPTFGN